MSRPHDYPLFHGRRLNYSIWSRVNDLTSKIVRRITRFLHSSSPSKRALKCESRLNRIIFDEFQRGSRDHGTYSIFAREWHDEGENRRYRSILEEKGKDSRYRSTLTALIHSGFISFSRTDSPAFRSYPIIGRLSSEFHTPRNKSLSSVNRIASARRVTYARLSSRSPLFHARWMFMVINAAHLRINSSGHLGDGRGCLRGAGNSLSNRESLRVGGYSVVVSARASPRIR